MHAQLALILRKGIKSGQYRPRDPLPSESQLMQQHGVARGTVRQAIETLRSEGLVHNHQRPGHLRRAKVIIQR